jgi:hypothetical protein
MVALLILGVWTAEIGYSQNNSQSLGRIQKILGVPPSVATLRDAWMPSGQTLPEFILIQDIHRHPEAQQQIAALILHGSRHWGTRDVFVEGAWATDEPLPSPRPRRRTVLADVRAGLMSGAELAAVMAPDHDLQLFGLEDSDIYRENVAAYQTVEKFRPEALRELNTARLFSRFLDIPNRPSWDGLQRLLELRLKPVDYQQYASHKFRPATDSALSIALRAAERYYELANLRSRVFLDVAKKAHRNRPCVLVVGGFHTGDMAKQLRQDGYSYVVVSPRVTQGGFEDLYQRGMRTTVNALKLR